MRLVSNSKNATLPPWPELASKVFAAFFGGEGCRGASSGGRDPPRDDFALLLLWGEVSAAPRSLGDPSTPSALILRYCVDKAAVSSM